MARHSAKHPGFKGAAAKIAARPGFHGNPGAILATAGRKASQAARKANPRLNKIGGMPKLKRVKC